MNGEKEGRATSMKGKRKKVEVNRRGVWEQGLDSRLIGDTARERTDVEWEGDIEKTENK